MASIEKTKRLGLRLGKEQKKLIEQAAGFLGQSISAFTVATLVQQAGQVVQRFGTLRLSDRDRNSFIDALDHPHLPNAKLHAAAKSHARQVAK